MVIYERRESDPTVYKLFEIEIVNNVEVRAARQAFMAQLKGHVNTSDDDDHDKTLQYAIRPLFRLTHEDGTVTEEEWAVVGYIGNVPEARRIMKEDFKADIANQRMIPWVGLAAPVDPTASVGTSNLFCFLPLGIHTPHPVHINGHFAVKQSRREIWTNYTDDISSQSSAGIKSSWNEFLFKRILPVAYARLLDSIGTSHGANYDLWPRTRASGLGMETLWKDLLHQCIEEVVTNDDYRVFFADSVDGEPSAVSYQMSTIADPVMDEYPLLLGLLKGIVNLVCGVPENITTVLRHVVDATGVQDNILTPQKVRDLLREHKHSWQDSTSDDAKVQILNYCISDDHISDLEGLPLLPMADGSWVEFKHKLAYSRYLVDPMTYRVLKFANENVVNIHLNDLPATNETFCGFDMFMSALATEDLIEKICEIFNNELYQGEDPPLGTIAQPSSCQFPSTEWLVDVWTLLSEARLEEEILEPLLGYHLVPVERALLAPLDEEQRVIHRAGILPNNLDVDQVLDLLSTQLGCQVVRGGFQDLFSWWRQCFVSAADIGAILTLLGNKSYTIFAVLIFPQRQLLCTFVSSILSSQAELSPSQRQSLGQLPVYQGYITTDLKSLYDLGGQAKAAVCRGFSSGNRPWELSSVTLLKEHQPMSAHLIHVLQVPVIQESAYWYRLFSELAETNSDDKGHWNPMMTEFLPSYQHCRDHDFVILLKDVPFVDVQSSSSIDGDDIPSKKLSPAMVVSRDLSQYFFQDETVFPVGMYCQPFNLAVLAELGMSTHFDAEFAASRITYISSMSTDPLDSSGDALQVIVDFFGRLSVEVDSSFRNHGEFVKCIEGFAWVPARIQSSDPFRLYTPDQCRPQADGLIVGAQLPTSPFVCTNRCLSSLLDWANPPPLQAVLDNLLDLSAQSRDGRYPQNFDESIQAIYRDLSGRTQDPGAVSIMKISLGQHRCILINRNLHAIDRVAIKIRSDCNLAPHFIQVPDSDFIPLFRALGVREEVTPKDMEGILVTIESGYQGGARLSDDDAGLVARILETIASVTRSSVYSPKMLILTEGSRLRELSDVVYNDMADASGIQEYTSSYVFSSNRISKRVASMLHIQMLSERIWSGCNDDFFQNWEQQVSVKDSISKILNDYGPDNIFSEYLQNAADAGATQFSIMLDHQFYSCDGILNDKMSVGQGPALVIWNDAEFTPQDFEGLRKMAMGSKRHDPEKIGRHGLGFNTAYHLTDLPSVVSGRHLVIFDPKHAYLPKRQTMSGMASDGAVRIDFISSELAQKFPGQVAPYQGRFGCDMTTHFHGTLFRLPLRRTTNTQNRALCTFGDTWDAFKVKVLIDRWAEDAKISMLFLKQIKTINLISEADKWTIVKVSEPVQGMTENTGTESSFCKVRIRAYGPGDQPSTNSTWLVGIDNTYTMETSTIRDIAQDGRWIPHRGIAMPLEQLKGEASTAFEGRLFSYLPTPIATDLPFHIHGVFALISNRKGLVISPAYNSHAAKWNEYMLSTLLPLLIVQTMSFLLRFKFDSLDALQSRVGIDGLFHAKLGAYFKLWPLRSTGDMTPMVQRFWELAHTSRIFPIRPLRQEMNTPVVQGFAGKDVCFPIRKVPLDVLPKLEQLLRESSVPLCECIQAVSSSAFYHWSKASLAMIQTDANLLRKVLRGNNDFMLKIRSQDGRDWLLELLLGVLLDKEQDGIDHLNGLALLPLEDDTWVSLCPNPAYYTASTTARSLFKNHKTLVKESAFATSKLPKILKSLEKDPRYGIMPLPPAKFTEYVCFENNARIPPLNLPRVWEYIRGNTDLTGFGDLPILTTIWGTVVPLRSCQGALKVSENDRLDSGSMLHKLGPVLQRAGVVVFQLENNDKHKYLEAKCIPCSDANVISAFVKSGGSLSSMAFDSNEASTLRDVIRSAANEFSHAVMSDLGFLQIWPSYGAAHGGSGLICAHGNQVIEGGHDIRNLGDSHNVIQGIFSNTFKRLGAHSVYLTDFIQDRVIPRLQTHVITPLSNRNHMTAYIHLLQSLVRIATTNSNLKPQAQRLLQHGSLILARDGSLHSCSELFDPQDTLLTAIYVHDSASRFPHQEAWTALLSGITTVAKFRQSSEDPVLIECANAVLEETEARPHAAATKAMARALVTKIYNKPSSANWMQSRWKIVPVSESLPAPYSSSAPYLPAYMSISELILEEFQNIAWTQCGLFPSDLEPSQNFRKVWAGVGQPRLHSIVDHLHVLAKDLAPTWTSESEQLKLRLALLDTYEALNEFADKAEANSAILSSLLTNMTAPYIFNSFEKEIGDPEAWYWPHRLILDIENPTATHHLVHSKLTPFRSFLAAAGVREMLSVVGNVSVAPAPPPSEFVTMLCNMFESQDRKSGFMDVCFRFYPVGQDIFAHKIVLAHWSEYFKVRFLGIWAEQMTRDPADPMLEVIDLSLLANGDEEFYAAFWGLLYYLYSHKLTPWNGPPTFAQHSESQSASNDGVGERVKYLLSLLALADEYQIPRLKDQIAYELVVDKMVMQGNVFEVRRRAELYRCRPIVEHCEKFVKKNAHSLRSFVVGEIAALQTALQTEQRMDGHDNDAWEVVEMKEELAEHKTHLEAIAEIVMK
ncbi:hypothetical protein BGZ82_009973 [Podila clonocystis]|nr:hypothetical protein BGZ82_009973 [Podila clonocystis]